MSQTYDKDPPRKVRVLRIGHRPDRDKRISTHVCLVARALGAKSVAVDRKDPKLEGTINSVTERFGGDFSIDTGLSWRSEVRKWSGTIVHLTMYGMDLERGIEEIPDGEPVMVVVGSEKVPREVYDQAHLNISVTNQPHSEVSALALFLDRLFDGKEVKKKAQGGDISILPDPIGKTVVEGGYPGRSIYKDPFSMKWPPVPDREQCLEILELLGCPGHVMKHILAVEKLGMEMVKRSLEEGPERSLDIREDILQAGLLLHDIGRCRTHSIVHITVGVDIAKRLGLDDRIVSIIHDHIGAGVTAEEAAALGLPKEDHIPGTLTERIVCHADNLVGSDRRRTLKEAVSRLERKGAREGARRMLELHRTLERDMGISLDEMLG